ncbi:MAG: hypothetical protein NT018_06615 [Armatimonadetes bacterium]|nr:hypothetical protein [Armatimonadota bacterium]
MIFNRLSRIIIAFAFAFLCCATFAGTPSELYVKSLLPDILLRRINTNGSGVPIVVFNPLSWTRTDAVEVESPFEGECPYVQITDGAGKVYPARALGDRLYFTARNLPALGYKVFWAVRSSKPIPTSIKCTTDYVENQFFRVNIDKKNAAITSIVDKVNKRQLMPKGSKGAILQMLNGDKVKEVSADSASDMIDGGPARGLLILENSYGDVPFAQELILHDGVPRVDIRLTTEWPEGISDTLKVLFPIIMKQEISTLGGVERIEDGIGVPSFKWLDISDAKYGVCLACDAAYNCSISNGCISAALLKQAKSNSEGGTYEVNYSLFTHIGDVSSGDVFERAMEVAQPLVARLQGKHKGELPATGSLFTFPDGGVVASLTGSDIIGRSPMLCFYETNGKATAIEGAMSITGFHLLEAKQNGRPIEGAKSITEKANVGLAASGTAAYLLVWEK